MSEEYIHLGIKQIAKPPSKPGRFVSVKGLEALFGEVVDETDFIPTGFPPDIDDYGKRRG